MKIEFLIMADAAQVVGGKLYMLGGGWTAHRAGNFPSPAQFAICISILVPSNETGIKYPLNITIADEAGVPIALPLNGQFEVGRPPDMPTGTMHRGLFAMNMGMPIPRPGKYVVSAAVGSSKAEVVFDAVFVGTRTEFPSVSEPDEKGN